MKKLLRVLVIAVALLAVLAVPVLAKGPKAEKSERGRSGKIGKPNVGAVHLGSTDDVETSDANGGRSGEAGKSNVAHLYLHEKDPTDWSIVEGGAWGKMKYNSSGPELKFVFNGHGLDPNTDYSLIYYPDPWPGTGLICLDSATVNRGGNVHISRSVDTGDLPAEGDDNYPDGAKIWLILSDDLDCDTGAWSAWTPTEYLFENNLITFDAD